MLTYITMTVTQYEVWIWKSCQFSKYWQMILGNYKSTWDHLKSTLSQEQDCNKHPAGLDIIVQKDMAKIFAIRVLLQKEQN